MTVATADNYEYDLAFSLCDEDLPFAQRIHTGLRDRFRLFLYSEEDKTLHFHNGVKKLSDIYRRKARCVLVLWRKEWGQSRWTRLEEEVLTDRVLNETPAFILLVKLEQGDTPSWIPSSYIYRVQKGWELGTLIETVAGKINQLGGEIHELTPIELAHKQKATREWKTKHEQLLLSDEAESARARATSDLFQTLRGQVEAINPTIQTRQLEFEQVPRRACVIRHPCCTVITEYEDVSEPPYVRHISVRLFDGIVRLYGSRNNWVEPAEVSTDHFTIDVTETGEWFWRNKKTMASITTARLANEIMNRLLIRGDEFDNGKRRRRSNVPHDLTDDEDRYHAWEQR